MSEPGVEQLPEKWRKRAEKAKKLGYTEKAIAVLDCADELEERMDADDGPEIRTDGGVDQPDSEHGWAECPKHGRYRDDEKMCPDCWDNAKAMGGGDWDA